MTDRLIDLRSDTVTQPSPEMRRAMAEAELGDDVFGDDPTVIALEERAAQLTGKEAALFVASGTMGNLVSLMAQVPRGGEIIAGHGVHSFAHEAANFAVVVGASMKLLGWDERGRMDLVAIRRAWRNPRDVHDPITTLVMLENTHSDSMAQPLAADYIAAVGRVAHDGGVPLHVDGARIFNASVALGKPVSELLAAADSASFCLSKGLACPVGSVVVGSRELIWKARRARKLLGGGMRQVGVLAAPGLIALRDGPAGMIERLAEDHANARRLAEGIADMPGLVGLDPARVATNFVFFELSRPELRMPFLAALERHGVQMIDYPGNDRIRAVTHYGIDAADIDAAISATRGALTEVGLAPAPAAAASAAPVPATTADAQLDGLIGERFRAIVARHPVFATYLGLHEYDDRLADGSRSAIVDDIADARRFLAALEQIALDSLSPYWAIERELALFTTRRSLFDDEVHRVWQRRVSASDEIGDGVFLLFARAGRPLPERLAAIAARLEAAPRHIEQQKTRLGETAPVRLWNEMELEAVGSLPSLFEEVLVVARREQGERHADVHRLERAAAGAARAFGEYAGWLRGQLGAATDEFALGSAEYDELIRLRAFDDLSTDDILEIGEQQLALNRAERKAVAREIDPDASEQEVVERVKSDHPGDFGAALATYRQAMDAARQHVVDHDIATLPAGESLDVIETPEYLRNVMPFAAYFSPPKFGEGGLRRGLYIVTPSVDGDRRAMREHNYASIYNTSIHEAYPGHHLQLTAANEHPSLVRLLVDAPEFVEGWAMYCELMMREEGFDTAPSHRLMMHTDAIWRACRIILDIKLQRGQIGVEQAIDFLVEQTGFERANAAAEVKRYTYTPTYQLSYLLGRVLLLRLREDQRRRLGADFSLRAFHDALLGQGSLPISFQRRLLAGEA